MENTQTIISLLLLIVRIIFGSVFIYYGIPKIKNLGKNAKDFENMGFKPGKFWGGIAAFLEVFGGACIILGVLFYPVLVLFSIFTIVGAVWKIFFAKKSFPEWSYDLILLALALILTVTGAGFLGF